MNTISNKAIDLYLLYSIIAWKIWQYAMKCNGSVIIAYTYMMKAIDACDVASSLMSRFVTTDSWGTNVGLVEVGYYGINWESPNPFPT